MNRPNIQQETHSGARDYTTRKPTTKINPLVPDPQHNPRVHGQPSQEDTQTRACKGAPSKKEQMTTRQEEGDSELERQDPVNNTKRKRYLTPLTMDFTHRESNMHSKNNDNDSISEESGQELEGEEPAEAPRSSTSSYESQDTLCKWYGDGIPSAILEEIIRTSNDQDARHIEEDGEEGQYHPMEGKGERINSTKGYTPRSRPGNSQRRNETKCFLMRGHLFHTTKFRPIFLVFLLTG